MDAASLSTRTRKALPKAGKALLVTIGGED